MSEPKSAPSIDEQMITVTLSLREWIGIRLALMGVVFHAEKPAKNQTQQKMNDEIRPAYQAILDRVTDGVFGK